MNDYPVGATSVVELIFLQDSTATDGSGKTGLVFNTSGLTCYYKRSNGTASVAVSLVTIATLGTYASGGFAEVDATHMGGCYEFHPPNAAFASGAKEVTFFFTGVTGLAPRPIKFRLLTVNPDSAAFGLSLAKTTNLTGFNDIAATAVVSSGAINTSSGAVSTVTTVTGGATSSAVASLQTTANTINAGVSGLGSPMQAYTQPSGFLAATFPGTVASPTNITAGVITTATNLTNLPSVPTDWLAASGVKADAVTKIQAGLATPTNITAGTITTTTNLTNAPTVGDFTSTMKTSLNAATPASVAGAVGSVTGAVGSVTGNVGGNVVGSVGSVTGGVTVTTNNDKTGYALANASIVTATFGTCDFTAAMKTSLNAATPTVTAGTVTDKTGYSLANASIATATFAGGATLPRVTLCDTTTTNTDMRGTDSALLASLYTAPLSAAGTRTAVGLGAANLDTQLNVIYTVAGLVQAKTDNLPAAPASTTNITGGVITTVTNLTNAPSTGDFTSTMKASLNAATPASVQNIVAQTGDVGTLIPEQIVMTAGKPWCLDGSGNPVATAAGVSALGSPMQAGSTVVLTAGSLTTASLGSFALAKGTNLTGFNDVAATAIVSAGPITTSAGAVSTVTTVTNLLNAPTNGDFTVAMKTSLDAATPQATIGAITDKTGYTLAANGLDAISIADPGGIAGQTTFPKILVALWRRAFKKTTLSKVTGNSAQLKTYGDDNNAVNTTQTLTDDGVMQTSQAAT